IALVRAVVVPVDRDASGVEAALDSAEVIERRLEPPRADRLAAEPRGLHLRRPQLAFFQAAGGHRGDHGADAIAVGRPWDIAEAVGLRAEPDAGRRLGRYDGIPFQAEPGRGEHPEFTSCQHGVLARTIGRARTRTAYRRRRPARVDVLPRD